MTSSLYKRGQRRSRRAAFTLVELMVSGTLGLMLMAGVLTTFLMIGRSSVRIINYSVMEKETRVAFEQLGIDARMASDFTARRTGEVITGFTLTIPTSNIDRIYYVTYGYANGTFYRVEGDDPAKTAGRTDLVTNITSLTFNRFTASNALIPADANDTGVKHIQASIST